MGTRNGHHGNFSWEQFASPGDDGARRKALSKVAEKFQLAWDERSSPELADFLPPAHHPLRRDALVGLIKIDLKSRWRCPPGDQVESFVERWPELRDDTAAIVELLTCECLWRSTYAQPPSESELQRRFPQLAHGLDLADVAKRSATMRTRESYLGTERFFLIREVGAGGMGKVYEAWDRERNGRVALKVLPGDQPQRLIQFKREFRSLAEIAHPNLVTLYELQSVQDQWFFTMELIDGVNFRSFIRLNNNSCPTDRNATRTVIDDDPTSDDSDTDSWISQRSNTDLDALRPALRQLVQGIQALHRAGKIHRDIKPSNVLVRPNGQVAILDFGLIAELEPVMHDNETDSQSSPSASGPWIGTDWSIAGTAAYMSPEQAAGAVLTNASDWYAVGVMLYEALTGDRPFRGARHDILVRKQVSDPPAPKTLSPGVPSDLNDLCVALLSRDPASRPSGEEILARLGVAQTTTPTAFETPQGVGPFVGREDQLGVLHEAFEEITQGKTATAYVTGRSGAGKSRLVQHFLHQISAHDDVVILPGRCFECESVPYKALDSLVDSLSRYLGWLPRSEADALMPRDIAVLARVFPVLQNAEAVAHAPQRSVDVPDLQELRRRAFVALREMLARIGDRKRLVLYIDDLHWGDVDSAVVLSELLRPPDPPRLLLLVSYRSEDREENACLSALKESSENNVADTVSFDLEVGPLDEDESQLLARMLLRDEDSFTEASSETIARESQGTPLFIYELAEHARAGGDLADLSADRLDLGLDEVLWSRVQHLPDETRRLLEAVAVASQPVPLRYIYEVAEMEMHDQRALAALRAGHLVRTVGPGLDDKIEVFHDRVRECVVQRLSTDVATSFHSRLAVSLEGWQDVDPETLAVHFQAANNLDKAGHYYSRAADTAAQTLAFHRAARLYRKAIEIDGRTEAEDLRLHRKLADALANAGHGFEAAQEYAIAAGESQAADALELERRAAHQYLTSGHFDEGLASLQRVLVAAGVKMPKTPRRALVSLLLRHGWLRVRGLRFHRRGPDEIADSQIAQVDTCWSAAIGMGIVDVVRAADFQLRGLLLALRAGEPSRVARGLALNAIHTAAGGSKTVARTGQLLAKAEFTAQQVEDPYTHGLVVLAKAAAAFMQGRFQQAYEIGSEAEETLRDRCTGVAWELDTAHTYQTWALVQMGEAVKLRRLAPALLQDAETRGDLFAMTNLRAYAVPHLMLWDDKPEQARTTVREALDRWSRRGFFAQHLQGMATEAEIALYGGDARGALDQLKAQWKPFSDSLLIRIQFAHVVMLFARARASLMAASQSAKSDLLLAAAEADARTLQRQSLAYADGMAELLRAGLAFQRGNADGAVHRLRQAAERLTTVDMRLHAEAARRQLGGLVAGDEGKKLIQESDTWMAVQGVRNPARVTQALAPGFPE